jgi:hypothetical protein
MRNDRGDQQVQIYMQLSQVREDIEVLILYAAVDFALSEAAVLYKAIKPAYMSITYDWIETRWSIGK